MHKSHDHTDNQNKDNDRMRCAKQTNEESKKDEIWKPSVLVISGGGMKGFLLPGAFMALEAFNFLDKVTRITGTSMGAIVGAFWSIGYTPEEMANVFLSTDFGELVSELSMANLLTQGWFGDGEWLESYVSRHIQDKLGIPDITLGELFERTGKVLAINTVLVPINDTSTASTTTERSTPKITTTIQKQKKMLVIDYTVDKDLSMIQAIRMTSCIPGLFKPIRYVYQGVEYDCFDGGALDNYLIHLYHPDDVLGLYLGTRTTNYEPALTGGVDTRSFSSSEEEVYLTSTTELDDNGSQADDGNVDSKKQQHQSKRSHKQGTRLDKTASSNIDTTRAPSSRTTSFTRTMTDSEKRFKISTMRGEGMNPFDVIPMLDGLRRILEVVWNLFGMVSFELETLRMGGKPYKEICIDSKGVKSLSLNLAEPRKYQMILDGMKETMERYYGKYVAERKKHGLEKYDIGRPPLGSVFQQKVDLAPEVDGKYLSSLAPVKPEFKEELLDILENRCVTLMKSRASEGKKQCTYPIPTLIPGIPLIVPSKTVGPLASRLSEREGLTVIPIRKPEDDMYCIELRWP